MNGNFAGLLAVSAADWELIIRYCIYAVVIAASIVALILLRRHTKLPGHGELAQALSDLLTQVEEAAQEPERAQFLKDAARATYRADRLAYTAALLAEKERYADLGKVSGLVEQARAALSPYKFGKKEAAERDGAELAAQKLREAICAMDGILERDADMKREES